MAQPIPSKPRTASSSHLATPNATPPTSAHVPTPTPFSETRLQQLLAHFDCGTHEFDRAERETALEKRLNGDALPTPPHSNPSSRRPSFLASLSLSRFSSPSHPSSGQSSGASTPAHTPVSASHPHLPTSLQMTSTSSPQRADPIQRPQSTPTIPSANALASATGSNDLNRNTVPPPMDKDEGATGMQRSNTMPYPKGGPSGPGVGLEFLRRKASMGQGMGAKPVMSALTSMDMNEETQRHFDPSKEPRLLGLL